MFTTRIRPNARVKPVATTNSSPANVMPVHRHAHGTGPCRGPPAARGGTTQTKITSAIAPRDEQAPNLRPPAIRANGGGTATGPGNVVPGSACHPSTAPSRRKHTTCVPAPDTWRIRARRAAARRPRTTCAPRRRRARGGPPIGPRVARGRRLRGRDRRPSGRRAAAVAACAGGRDRAHRNTRPGGVRAARRRRRGGARAGGPLPRAGAAQRGRGRRARRAVAVARRRARSTRGRCVARAGCR